MKFDARSFVNTATAIAGGELQGQLEAEQERRNRDLQAYQQAVSQFQIGHQLEQEQRQRQADPYRLALQLAPQVQPGARGGFISEALTNIGQAENQPFSYGLDQFNQLQGAGQRVNPNAQPFSIPSLPTGNNPWAQVAGAFTAPPGGGGGGQPQAPPPPPPPPPGMVAGGPTALPAPDPNALPFQPGAPGGFATTEPKVVAPGSDLVQAMGDVNPQMANPLQPRSGAMGPTAFPAPQPPLGVGPGALEQANQFVFGPMLPAFQTVQARTQGVTQTAAVQGGGSGSNPQATQPPNTRGTIPDQTPTSMGAGAPVTSTAGAPPPPIPASASVGTAPVTVAGGGGAGGQPGPPPNVLHIPGFSRDYPYGEVDQRAQTAAVTRRQAAIAHLRDINAPPEVLQQVQDLIGRSGQPDTQAGLQQYDFVTQQIESLGVGQGSGIYRARLAAQRTPANLVTQFLAAVKSGPRDPQTGRVDPTWVHNTALAMGMAPELATQFASGDFSDPEIKKLLDTAVQKIYTPGFNQLPIATQDSLLQAAQGYADTLHVPITLPPAVIQQLTPYQREQLDLQRVRVSQTGRAQDIAEGRLRLSEWQTQAKIDGLLGGAGGKGGKLTFNAQVLAARKPYDDLSAAYKSLHNNKDYASARDKYDTAKNNLLAATPDETPEQEEAAIRHIIADPRTNAKARIIATADLRRLHASQSYQNKVKELVAGAGQAEAPGQTGTRTIVPEFAPSGGRAVTAPAGVAAPGQTPAGGGATTPMIFTNPKTGEKRRVLGDPAKAAQSLLKVHPDWKLPQAQRAVQLMIQEAKSGRSR